MAPGEEEDEVLECPSVLKKVCSEDLPVNGSIEEMKDEAEAEKKEGKLSK